jgi:N-acetyl-anhydromuramyl-L-alanine amidase AmpD
MPWYDHLRQFDRSSYDFDQTSYFIEARNFRVPSGGTRLIKQVVIHITGGPAQSETAAINHFLGSGASAHYIINRSGVIVQMVRNQNIANHIRNLSYSVSQMSIGIEHVNTWTGGRQQHPTAVQYDASAALVKWLCGQYGIPRRHSTDDNISGIIGHNEADPNTGHTACPTPAWDWQHYMRLL